MIVEGLSVSLYWTLPNLLFSIFDMIFDINEMIKIILKSKVVFNQPS